VVREIEDAILDFVKRRVAEVEYEDIHCANDILRRMTEDDEAELKDYIFDLMKREISWGRIIEEVEELAMEKTVCDAEEPCEYPDESEEEA